MTTRTRALGVALARAALAGNPSDGYGGAVLAVTLPGWSARAEAVPAPRTHADPPSALVEATLRRFGRELARSGPPALVRWRTSIPQRVGLGSSSALVIAVLRALCRFHGVELAPDGLAELALAVETEDMGITAGLQDRVAQAYEGLTFMEFSERRYERLDPGLLPPLLVAWRTDAASHSGPVHDELQGRHRSGEPGLKESMSELADTARRARDALLAGELRRFAGCVDETFDLRRALMPLDPRCVEMVESARACGARVNYTGSGGAIVAVCLDAGQRRRAEHALKALGAEVANPSVSG